MPQTKTELSVFPTFRNIVAKSLRIDPEKVTMDASLTDLGAESLDLVDITMDTEEAFHVWLPEKSILDSAREVFGKEAIEHDGRITELGKRMLADRMPGRAELLQGEVTVAELQRSFMKVGAWVALIERLASDCPSQCECGGELVSAGGFRLKCALCSKAVDVRSGEELNREWLQQYQKADVAHSAAQSI